ncbi:hypothetical protein L0664_14875 [Octadecabacter sp. G9-8]|uniref:Lasso RiPP family leader peptide-containing protein n=1 Tax=Octadecabacter dasysiphoniae TaxID=2909341 RepID=A0ABS9D1S2_9RHOB|nr:hypothetical protein [Octadecabacter dasysiphoniae]MCF2872356.1 hypothetical protein [Octadecabacter dasysiphoniae]
MSEENKAQTEADQKLPTYVAPELKVLDASETAGGSFTSPTEGPYSRTS